MLNPTTKKYLVYSLIIFSLIVTIPIISSCTHKENQISGNYMYPNEFVDFEQFILKTESATLDDFLKNDITKVSNKREFTKMQKHILSLYKGVTVNNSFVMETGGHVDCIDINKQPGLRQNGQIQKLATPPPPLKVDIEEGDQKAQFVEPMLSKDKKDRFDNVMYCPEGHIPMRRITLEELTRYKTLGDFFNKYGKTGRTGLPDTK